MNDTQLLMGMGGVGETQEIVQRCCLQYRDICCENCLLTVTQMLAVARVVLTCCVHSFKSSTLQGVEKHSFNFTLPAKRSKIAKQPTYGRYNLDGYHRDRYRVTGLLFILSFCVCVCVCRLLFSIFVCSAFYAVP